MVFESDKIMFEIYKDTLYNHNYRVVYFTELNDHNKHEEITRATTGEHYFDGFIREFEKEHAKEVINRIVSDLNNGVSLSKEEIRERLDSYLV
jgi:hypothetical protein